KHSDELTMACADITNGSRSSTFFFYLAPSCGDGYTVHMIACLSRLLMIAALGVLLAACNRQAPPPTPKTDLDRLQGTWNLVSAMQDGKALPEDKVKQTTIVFKGDTFRFPGSAEYATSKAGTIKLDESKTPTAMDAISTDKEVMLCINALQDNTYMKCIATCGKP